MPARKTESIPNPEEVASEGTHVVAIVVGDETQGYVANLGSGIDRAKTEDRARRFGQDGAETMARMHNAAAESGKRPERFEAREVRELFGGEGA